MRQFGIIEASGNDKAWWVADRHLPELTAAVIRRLGDSRR
jgi:hypothetical protein